MDAEELRSTQGPLKERYRESPEAALITLRAEGRLGEGVTCSVETGKALVQAGLHPATGGSGLSACSGDMLLEALVACAGVTLNAVATALGIHLRDASLQAEGDLDFRGTLGLSKEVLVGFRDIRLQFTLDTDASEEQLAALLRLTERYCVVYQTLAHPPAIAVTRRRAPAFEALRLELRDYLADTRQAIDDEIRCYPKPIPRCDAQFNFLYEQRSRVAQLIERVDSASNPEASRRELIDVVEDFVNSTPLLESPRERELRERLKEHIT